MTESAMAIGFRTSITSSAVSGGCNSTVLCHGVEDFGWSQLSGQFGWRRILMEGKRFALGGSNHGVERGAISSGCWSPLSGLSDCQLFSARKRILQTKIPVTADYSGSDPLQYHGEPGYHPLEELQECEKTENGDLRLTDAEIARTIVEVNNNAKLMFLGTLHHELHENIFWPELQYVTDEYGDIYFEVNDDEDILHSLSASNSPVRVLIGLDNVRILREQEIMVADYNNDFYIEDTSDSETDSELEDNYEEDWISNLQEEENSDLSESLEDWVNLETMHSTHPLYFSKKLAEVVSTDYSEQMDRPSKGLAILGLIRPTFMEEQSCVQKYLYGEEFSSTDIIDHGGKGKDELVVEFVGDKEKEPELEPVTLAKDDAVWENGSEKDDDFDIGLSLYKLEILNIQLVCVYGNQSVVSLQDFQQADPDILAHSASTIITRINAGGVKTEYALKSLCRKVKGIQVEEATLIGVDSLGVDLRVRSGTQVQTLRFAFGSRATSEYAAEQQLRHLLFPRFPHWRQRQRQARHLGN